MRVYTDASTRGGISGLGYVATTARDKELYSHGIWYSDYVRLRMRAVKES